MTERCFTLTQNPIARAIYTPPAVTLNGIFTDEELIKLIATCESGEFATETAGTDSKNRVRISSVTFITRTETTEWIFERINAALVHLNDQHFQFDLSGYSEFQFTRYEASEDGKYDWHIDMQTTGALATGTVQPRKLSVTLLLNDDFEGGEFQINISNEDDARTLPLRRGMMVAFPSFVLHRIRPVTRGTRRSIVVWVVGNKFK